jgi:hypothetical protein
MRFTVSYFNYIVFASSQEKRSFPTPTTCSIISLARGKPFTAKLTRFAIRPLDV